MAATLRASGAVNANTTAGNKDGTIAVNGLTAGNLLVVVLGGVRSNLSGATALTCSATGYTFTAIAGADQTGASALVDSYRAVIPSSGNITLNVADNNQTYGILVFVWEVSGFDTTTPIGGKIAVADASNDGAKTITLDATPASSSILLAACFVDTDTGTGKTIDVGTGWTEDGELTGSTYYGVAQAQHITGVTSTSVTWNDLRPTGAPVTYTFAGVGIEVKMTSSSTTVNPVGAVVSAVAGTANIGGTTTINPVGAVVQTVAGTGLINKRYPATIDTDNRTVLDQFGAPWVAVGDTAWSAIGQLTLAQMVTYLDDRAAKGYRWVIINAPEYYFADDAPNDPDGNYPFTGVAYQSPLNEAAWQRVDYFIDQAAIRGITVLLAPAYLGLNGTEGWQDEITAATNTQMTTYGQTVGARYASRQNIVWLIGGDLSPGATLQARMDAMATAIKTQASQLMTAMTQRGTTADAVWGAYSWLDLNNDYRDGTQIAVTSETAYADVPTRPFFGMEYRYEYEASSGSGVQHRSQLWGSLLEGAIGSFMGNNPIWSFGASNRLYPTEPPASYDTWPEALNSPLSLAAEILASFIDSYTATDWAAMNPGAAVLTAGEGSTTTKAAVLADTASGRAAIYFPTSRSITVDLSVFTPDSVQVRWFDPTTGSYTTVGSYTTTGTTSPAYPSTAVHADWVLVVDPAATVNPAGAVVAAVAGTAAVAGQADIGPTGATVAAASGAAGISAQADITPTGAVVTAVAGTASVSAQADVTPVGSVAVTAAGTVQITATATVTPVGAAVAAVAGTVDVSGAPTVNPVGAVVTAVAGVAALTATANLAPVGAVVVVIAGTVNVTSLVDDPNPITATWRERAHTSTITDARHSTTVRERAHATLRENR